MIFKLVFFAFATTFILVILKENSPPMALSLSMAGCTVMFMISAQILPRVIDAFDSINLSGIKYGESISVVAKSLAVAYITSFGSDICTDAGATSIAHVLQASGKLIMLSMAFPLLIGIFNSVVSVIG